MVEIISTHRRYAAEIQPCTWGTESELLLLYLRLRYVVRPAAVNESQALEKTCNPSQTTRNLYTIHVPLSKLPSALQQLNVKAKLVNSEIIPPL